MGVVLLLMISLTLGTRAAFAHDGSGPLNFNFDPWVTLPLALSAWAYVRGVRTLWRHAGRGRGVSERQAACFALGWLTLFVALVSPLDYVADELFSVHMIQHELLMVIAAPLLVLSRPLGAWAWALPAHRRPQVGRALRYPPLRAAWRALTAPLSAWLLHAAALWLWHVPAFFNAVVTNNAIHIAQHLCFVVTSLLFWWTVIGERSAPRRAVALVSLFTTMMHMGVLGALLTFAPVVLYEAYLPSTLARGIDPLHDQQLGGLLMWVPAGTAYLVAGLFVAARLLREEPPVVRGMPEARG
jgi:putative membrane protein